MLDWRSGGPRFEFQLGRIFFTSIPYNEEMNQMVKNKDNNNNNYNSSNSLVFGWWPQTKIISTFLLNIFQLQSNELSCCVWLPLTFFFAGKRPSARSPASAPEARRGHEGVRGLECRRTRNWSQGQSRLRRRRPQQAEVLAARAERHSTGLGKSFYKPPPAACFFSLSVRKCVAFRGERHVP